jgi:hypothetical protein
MNLDKILEGLYKRGFEDACSNKGTLKAIDQAKQQIKKLYRRWDKMNYPIDKKMKNLIKELNIVGLTTTQHCCGHDKKLAYLYLDLSSIKHIEIKDMGAGKRLILRWRCK